MDKRVTVLFVLPSLKGGGAEKVAVTLLRHLDRARVNPALAIFNGDEPAYASELPPDVEIVVLNARRVRYGLVALAWTIWRRRPAIVFSMIGHLNLGVAVLKPFLPRGVRLCARETNVLSEMLGGMTHRRIWQLAYRRLYRRFDTVVCQSATMRDEVVRECRVPPHKALVIPNPVDVEAIRRLSQEHIEGELWGSGAIRLVVVGRLSAEKGLDLLLEALALLREPRYQVLILGDGPLRGELEAMALALGLADQARFLGFVRNPYRYMARADALLLCSRSEAYPNVVLEALACGVPVIATPAPGGIHEIATTQPDVTLCEQVTAQSLARVLSQYQFRGRHVVVQANLAAHSAAAVAVEYDDLFSASGP